jgi:hypothetical protein
VIGVYSLQVRHDAQGQPGHLRPGGNPQPRSAEAAHADLYNPDRVLPGHVLRVLVLVSFHFNFYLWSMSSSLFSSFNLVV